ncbi:sugar ABC transporter permease, partial [Streptococcus pyogenes]
MHEKKKRNEAMWGLGMVAPTIIGLLVLNIIPIFQTLKMSFYRSGDFGKGDIFVGLSNYQKMFA